MYSPLLNAALGEPSDQLSAYRRFPYHIPLFQHLRISSNTHYTFSSNIRILNEFSSIVLVCYLLSAVRGLIGGYKRMNTIMRHGIMHESPGYVCSFCSNQQHNYLQPDNIHRCVISGMFSFSSAADRFSFPAEMTASAMSIQQR
jgi:hypothetical protein